jgi:signal transduction histidine kinase
MITVSDNGRGLQAARSTSHGLHIMKERALLIGATLEIGETPSGGLAVTVRLSENSMSDSPVPDNIHEKVTA